MATTRLLARAPGGAPFVGRRLLDPAQRAGIFPFFASLAVRQKWLSYDMFVAFTFDECILHVCNIIVFASSGCCARLFSLPAHPTLYFSLRRRVILLVTESLIVK